MVKHKARIVRKALDVNEKAARSGDPVEILAALGAMRLW